MKAEIKPRINLEGRTRLETVIPLSTPFILFVDPASVCNFKCSFCPTGDRPLISDTGRWQGRLHMDNFTKIIDDLEEFDQPLKVLRLYKEGEPLLNTNLPKMIRYAKASRQVPYIDTTTNGYLLTPKNVDALIEAGLDRINISVDGLSDEMFWDLTKTKVDFKKFVEQIKYLADNRGQCEICIKMIGDKLSEDEKKKFFDIFGDLCDRIALENLAPCWPEFDADVRMGVEITQGIYQQEIGDVDTCPYIFYSISVNSDGTVSLCFLDWARKLVIGDTRTQSLKSIWEGEALFQHRLAHLQGNRKANPVCAACGQLSHCMPDSIDPYRAMLAEKLIASRHSLDAVMA
ncbi:MAG: radical SAM/SPASM domain-containing protein [Alphaproteobacteria bacterium]|nr:radical SAM/SPASM domain-containing protein [Alphaproteobacteria bacterium]